MIFCGDFNCFVNFVQTNFLYLMPSRRASLFVGVKMVSKCRALICLYYTWVSWQVNSYPDQYITGWVPAQAYFWPRYFFWGSGKIVRSKTITNEFTHWLKNRWRRVIISTIITVHHLFLRSLCEFVGDCFELRYFALRKKNTKVQNNHQWIHTMTNK